MDFWDSKYISRDYLRNTVNELRAASQQVKNITAPIQKLLEDSNETENVLKVLGFFQVPGSNKVLENLRSIREHAKLALRSMEKISFDRATATVNELFFKLDGLYKELDKGKK